MKFLSKIILFSFFMTASSFAADGFSIGGRASLNYNMLWGEEALKENNGFGFNAGGSLLYQINPMIAISPEITFAYRVTYFNIFKSAFAASPSNVSFTFLNLDIPVLARMQVIQPVYFEIGPQLSLNLSATYLTKSEINSQTLESEGDIKDPSLAEFGLIFGVGKKFDIGTGLDVNFRFMLGLTKAFETSEYLTKISGKMMMFHLGTTYWFI